MPSVCGEDGFQRETQWFPPCGPVPSFFHDSSSFTFVKWLVQGYKVLIVLLCIGNRRSSSEPNLTQGRLAQCQADGSAHFFFCFTLLLYWWFTCWRPRVVSVVSIFQEKRKASWRKITKSALIKTTDASFQKWMICVVSVELLGSNLLSQTLYSAFCAQVRVLIKVFPLWGSDFLVRLEK